MKNIKTYLLYGATGGACYLFGRLFLFKMDAEYTSLPDWLFRIVMVVFVTLVITHQKRKNNGLINVKEGIIAGSFTTLFLAISLSAATWVHCQWVNPNYIEGYKTAYRDLHYPRMIGKYVKDHAKENATQAERDELAVEAKPIVEQGLAKNMEDNVAFLFTTMGQVIVTLLYAFFWGFAITFTVAMLSRKVIETK